MSKLDDAILQQLSAEDAEFLARFEREPSSAAQLVGIFRGPFAWLSFGFLVVAILLGFAAIFAAWRFMVIEDLRAMVQWGALALLAFLILMTIRIWFFMEIQTNRVVREIRRLQLQIARAAIRE